MKSLVRYFASLRYEQWLILIVVLLLCSLTALAIVNNEGLEDYRAVFRYSVSYATLCPRQQDGSLPVMQSNIRNGPQLRQVVAGLGVPDFVYHDNYPTISSEATYVTVGLDYPELGVSVFSSYWVKGGTWSMQVRLNPALQVDSILCYPPTGSLADTLRVYHYNADMSERMPWPGFDAWLQ